MNSFEYIIAVDFEATCFEDDISSPYLRNAEIIEFPAVLFNLKTGKEEAVFHEYIKPAEKPQLSKFCVNLTGISQKTVDNGISLEAALNKFHEWLKKELNLRHLILPKYSKTNNKGNCAFVTWSDYDFGAFLHLECQRKNIIKPLYFNQWIDLRHAFSICYGNNKCKFTTALRIAGLRFVGKKHSGIDDAKNLAKLTYKLFNKGINLNITADLTPNKKLNENVFF